MTLDEIIQFLISVRDNPNAEIEATERKSSDWQYVWKSCKRLSLNFDKYFYRLKSKPKLLPCPFCGDQNPEHHVWTNGSTVQCTKCHASCGEVRSSDDVTKLWNSRA